MSSDEPSHSTTLPHPPGTAQVPSHVAIIMDGNGRWATGRGLARIEGHERGMENIRRITRRAGELGIKYLTLWAFSTENWNRPAEEIKGILKLLAHAIEHETPQLHSQGARLRHIGELDALDSALRQSVHDAIALTQNNSSITLTLAFNYGGRRELVMAARSLVASGVAAESIDEESLRSHLYDPELPDADLIIRTSGEIRMSNFLLWQGAFAEFVFSPRLWPDFSPDDLDLAVAEYARRERRFGAVVTPGA